MSLTFRTDRPGQTLQTQIRLLLEEQSDRGLHCLLFHLHHLMKYPKVSAFCLSFRKITANFSGVRKFGNFMVYCYDPKFSERIAMVNSAHPDQTAPRAD